MFLRFYEQAWQDYLYWFKTDQKTCKRIHKLIRDTKRSPFAGLGKPEALLILRENVVYNKGKLKCFTQ